MAINPVIIRFHRLPHGEGIALPEYMTEGAAAAGIQELAAPAHLGEIHAGMEGLPPDRIVLHVLQRVVAHVGIRGGRAGARDAQHVERLE